MKTNLRRLTSVLMILFFVFGAIPFAAADTAPLEYVADEVLDLVERGITSHNNEFTSLQLAWTQGDQIFLALTSHKNIDFTDVAKNYMILNGTTASHVYMHADGAALTLNSIGYATPTPSHNYKWTVFQFPRTSLTGMSLQSLAVILQAQGHSIPEITFPMFPAYGEWIPQVTKALAGRDLVEGEFTFDLYQGTTLLQTTTNDALGGVVFDAIGYTEDNIGQVFTYTIVERAEALGGVTYDDLAVTVTVLVQDGVDGVLTLDVMYSEDTVFNNQYAATGIWTPQVTKELNGRTLAAEEFSFVLKSDAEVIQTKTNEADGQVLFEAIHYTAPGTYEYEFSEIKGNAFGITYDETLYEVTVEVVDNGEGTLTATPSVTSVVFTNTFMIPTTDVTATKVWVGGPQLVPVIELQLYQDDVAYGDAVLLDGVTTYTWKGLPKTDAVGTEYAYTIKETVVPKNYIATYSEDGLTVTNTFTPGELPDTSENPEQPKTPQLPNTGVGSNMGLLITGLGLVCMTGILSLRTREQ